MEKCAELRKKQSESPDNAIFVVGLTTPTSPATVIKISKEELQFIEELEGGVPSEEVAPREVIDIWLTYNFGSGLHFEGEKRDRPTRSIAK